jgi:glycosyltransferase involved in cell wall biosynthesis
VFEGFGFPPLEAMGCGTPVVASTASSVPEVVGDAGLLADPHSPEQFAECIGRVLADPALAAGLRERGLARAGTFTWDQAARRTREVLLSVTGRSLPPPAPRAVGAARDRGGDDT